MDESFTPFMINYFILWQLSHQIWHRFTFTFYTLEKNTNKPITYCIHRDSPILSPTSQNYTIIHNHQLEPQSNLSTHQPQMDLNTHAKTLLLYRLYTSKHYPLNNHPTHFQTVLNKLDKYHKASLQLITLLLVSKCLPLDSEMWNRN